MKVCNPIFALVLAGAALAAHGETPATHSTPAAASAPTAIPALVPYSGVALKGDGGPLASEVNLTFLIYKDEAGGEPLWVESQAAAVDSTGHYKVQLGATNPNGLPADLFATGEARWLEVQIAGEASQPRVLLASVPYALKAADATTLGGLPASAFALAGTRSAAVATSAVGTSIVPDANSTVTTPGGKTGYLPVFTGATTIGDSILFASSTGVGVGDVPNSTAVFDVNGKSIWRGLLNVSRAGTATSSKGYDSYPMLFQASAYNSSSKAATLPEFQLQAEPVSNNTANPGGSFNLLYNANGGTLAETGLFFNSNGTIHFASGQTFPGTVPAVAGNNTYTGSNTFVPSIYEDTDVNIDVKNANAGNISPGLRLGNASGEGMASKRTAGGNQYGVDIYTGYSPRLSVNAAGQVAIGTGATFGAGAQLQVQSVGTYGIYSETTYNTYQGAAVYGQADSAAEGVVGASDGGIGAEFFGGTSSGGAGEYGSYSGGGSASGAQENGGYGVYGYGGDADGNAAIGGHGGYFHGGYSTDYIGGFGGYFVGGDSGASGIGGYGIFVTGGSGSNGSGPDLGFSAIFQQAISVNGATVDNAHNIKIDDPADPANKYLVHSSVSSSEQMNIYSGNVTTDELGVATVTLPSWFQELNADFRYQLTVVGGRFAQAIVSKEIEHNQFTISTNATGVKVSWQVTGVRQDAYAKANPLVVEQTKGPRERGFYQHPELYGQPQEKQTEWGLHPEMMAKLKAARPSRPAPVKATQGLTKSVAKLNPPTH